MVNKIIKSKSIKPVIFFDEGGPFSKDKIGGTISNLAGGATSILSNSLELSKIDAAEEQQTLKSTQTQQTAGSSLDEMNSLWGNALFADTNITSSDIRGVTGGQMVGNTLSSIGQGAMAGSQVGGILGAATGALVGLGSSLTGIFAGNIEARKEAKRLNKEGEIANRNLIANLNTSTNNVLQRDLNMELINRVADGGRIYIKPSKKDILWHHAYGGPLYDLSGDWTNGLTFINAGGTHEQNPFEGVQIGVDPQGIPNLVEEGEIIYNDYVFSNRLKPTKKQLEDSGLNKKYEGWTFAKIVEDLQKESADNPIDFISQNTLEDMISIVTNMQEEIRMKRNKKNNNKFPWGGLVDLVEENIGPEESDALIESFWGAAKTPEQRLAVMELDPSNAYKKPNNPTNKFNWQSLGRYAPVLADATTLIHNAFQEPDYSNANAGLEAMQRIPVATVTPIGGKQQYIPVDRNYLLNKQLNASRAASRDTQNRALTGSQTLAHLANLNYNTQTGMADSLIQMDRENMARRLQTAQFNLGIDQYNANQAMQARQMNQQRAYNIAQAEANAAQMREAIDAQRTAAISQGLSGLSEGLAGIGTESVYKDWLGALTDTKAIQDVFGAAANTHKTKKACGGRMLTKKRK